MTDLLQPFAEALFDALRPLERALREPVYLGALAKRAGYRVRFDDGALGRAFGGLSGVATRATASLARGQAAIDALADGGSSTEARVVAVADLLDAGRELVEAIDDVRDALDTADLSALPEPLRDPAAWRDLLLALPQVLLVDWLEGEHPVVHRVVAALGVVDPVAGRVNLTALGALLDDPGPTLVRALGWPPARPEDAEPLLEHLLELFGSLGLPSRLARVREPWVSRFLGGDGAVVGAHLPLVEGYLPGGYATFGLAVFPVADPGLVLGLVAEGDAGTSFALDDAGAWTLGLSGGAGGTGSAAVRLTAAGASGVFDDPTADVGVRLGFAPATPYSLLGRAPGTRLDLGGASLHLALAPDDVALTATLDAFTVVVVPSGAGAFFGDLFGGQTVTAAVDLGLTWSSKAGFAFQGGAALSHRVLVARQLGPLYLDALSLGLSGADGGGLAFAAGVDLTVALSVLTFTAADLGIELTLRGASGGTGNVGPFDVGVGFRPPSMVGIALDVSVGSGGGVLLLDPEAGRYAGAVEVDLFGVGIGATGVIATKLPGVDWSMFVSLHASFDNLQIGFGFTLEKVGGLFGAHRSLDATALGDAVRSGSLDAVLFPEDPIGDADRIFAALDAIFPPRRGQFVFGPIARIGWGTPTVVTADVGLVVQLPDPVTVSLLGSLRVVLPRDDLALVELHVDVVGTVDVTAGTLAVDASLRDSHVLGLDLHGEMALRAGFGGDASFLFAFGGFHPSFVAPTGFPSLRRLGVSLDSGDKFSLSLSGYFAVTSNTLQFGARANLWAKAAGLTVEGHVGFDALLTFAPFGFDIDLGFSVDVRAGSIDLFGVALDLALDGPNPWHGVGTATLKVAGIKKNFRVEATIGRKEAEGGKPVEDAEALLLDALRADGAWSAVPGTAAVVYAAVADAALAVDPDGSVQLVQRVLPLGRTLDHLGSARIDGPARFELSDPTLGGDPAPSTPVDDWFAPACFFELRDNDKLASPSFERMQAGVRLGGEGAASDAPQGRTLGWEEIVVDPAASVPRRGDQPTLAPGVGVAAARPSPFAVATPRVRLADPVTVDLSRELSWSEAAASRRRTQVIVPAWERG